jgi:hypothetical protein
MLNSKTNTITGSESTANTYNSLRVFVESTTKDKDGRVVLFTDARPFINARGQVVASLRAQARSAAVEFNPNTYLKRTMTTEAATGLLSAVDIKTASGRETTNIKYNTLRVETGNETKNARGVTILQSRTYLDNNGRPVDAQGRRITNVRYVKHEDNLINGATNLLNQEIATGLIWHEDRNNEAGVYVTDSRYDSLRRKVDFVTKDASSGRILYTGRTIGYNRNAQVTEEKTDYINKTVDRLTSDNIGNLVGVANENTITDIVYDDQRQEKASHTYVNLGTLENSQKGQEFLTGWTISYGVNAEGRFRLLKQGRHI